MQNFGAKQNRTLSKIPNVSGFGTPGQKKELKERLTKNQEIFKDQCHQYGKKHQIESIIPINVRNQQTSFQNILTVKVKKP